MKTIALISALLFGCATAGGQVLKNCELAQLSSIEKSAAVCVAGALGGAINDWQSAVTTCGESLIPSQLACVVAAVVAAAESGAPKASFVAARGRQWLSDHGVNYPPCR